MKRVCVRVHSCMFVCLCVCAVSKAIQSINEAVDSGEASQTLAALRGPGTGLYGVTAECAQTYQGDLSTIKEEKKKEGKEEAGQMAVDRPVDTGEWGQTEGRGLEEPSVDSRSCTSPFVVVFVSWSRGQWQ